MRRVSCLAFGLTTLTTLILERWTWPGCLAAESAQDRGFRHQRTFQKGIHKPRVTGSSPVAAISFLTLDLRFFSIAVFAPVTTGFSLQGSSVLHLAQSVMKKEDAGRFSHTLKHRGTNPTQVCDTGLEQQMSSSSRLTSSLSQNTAFSPFV